MPLAVELRGVSFAYSGGPPVLRDVDLAVEAGEFVAIAGPNGGGKTTLLRVALGLERPTRGAALLFGEPAQHATRRSRIGYLAQRARLGIEAPVTVRELVAAGLRRRGAASWARPTAEDRARVDEAIERVGLLGAAPPAGLAALRRPAAAGVRRQGARRGSRSCSCWTSRPPGVDVDAQESLARAARRAAPRPRRHDPLRLARVRRRRALVDRLVLVRGTIVFDGSPDALPPTLARPLARPCLTASSCGSRSRPAPIVGAARARGRVLPRPAAAEPDRRRDRPRRLRRASRSVT